MSILGEFDVAAYGDFTVCVFIINAGTQNFRSTQHPEGLAERSEASGISFLCRPEAGGG